MFKIYLPRVEQPLQIEIEPVRSIPLLQGTEAWRAGEDLPSIPRKPAHRILVVDDDVSVRQLTTELLIRAGFVVDAATDGATGWEALQAKQYDLVITDNFMPKLTGIEMVKKIHAGNMNLPVINRCNVRMWYAAQCPRGRVNFVATNQQGSVFFSQRMQRPA